MVEDPEKKMRGGWFPLLMILGGDVAQGGIWVFEEQVE
jgi:hypothetical protein